MHLSTLVEIAADLRRRSNQIEPAFSTRQIIESCFPDLVVTGSKLEPGIDELVSVTPQGTVLLYRRGLSIGDQRFAIAHGLGHLVLDGTKGACRPGRVGDPERELRADRFAAELLVPLAELRPYVGRWPSPMPAEHELYLDMVDEIASHFKAPARVIDQRIRELARTTNLCSERA